MKQLKTIVIQAAVLLIILVPCSSSADEGDRATLKAMLTEIEAGINEQDFSKIGKHLHKDVIITFHNAELTKGIDGAEAYMKRMFEGSSAVLKSFSTKAAVDQPAIFYGDTAVAAGYTNERYNFTDGLGFDLYTRWSTALAKENGNWKVIALHFSNNLFDNAILDQARNSNYIYAAGGVVVGIILMWIISILFRKKRNA